MITNFSKTYDQIIVVGNGFDLACDLPSRYSDFFSDTMEDYKIDPGTEDYVSICNESMNIWLLIFIYATHHPITDGKSPKNVPWQDVEEVIKRCVSSYDEGDYNLCQPRTSYTAMAKPDDVFLGPITEAIAKQLQMSYPSLLDDVQNDARQLDLLEEGNEIDPPYWLRGDNRIALAYIQELYKFEIMFKDYLSPHATKTEYLKAAKDLYLSISNYCENGNSKKTRDVVLSFNYTTPLLEPINIADKEIARRLWVEKNIHGTLSTPTTTEQPSPIIFGIDGFTPDGMRDGNVYQIFSKSYRQLYLKQKSCLLQ